MLTSGPILFLLLKQVPISTKNPPGYTPECIKLILKFRNFLGEAPQTLKKSKFLQVFVAWFVPPPHLFRAGAAPVLISFCRSTVL